MGPVHGVIAYVGLGSNLGDRPAHLARAVELLRDVVEVRRMSPVYETDPVGPPQPDFLNAVVEVDSALDPPALLRELKRIERAVGRRDGPRWGPREIDLDLLLYGDVVSAGDPVLPHPEMTRRAFVLVPLADLAPGIDVGDHGTVAELLDSVDSRGVRPYAT